MNKEEPLTHKHKYFILYMSIYSYIGGIGVKRLDCDICEELCEHPQAICLARNELISELQDHMNYIMEKAEENGFLFELITQWPRQKVAMYEAAVVMQRQVLRDEENYN